MNIAGIAEIFNALYYFFLALGGLATITLCVSGIRTLVWGLKLGGINSMGTRAFTSEAMKQIFAGLVVGQFTWLSGAVMGDMFNGKTFSWVPVQDTGNSFLLAGQFLNNGFILLGMWLAYSSTMEMRKTDSAMTFGNYATVMLIAILCTQMQWLSEQISNYTPFNPLGLFFGTSVISIK